LFREPVNSSRLAKKRTKLEQPQKLVNAQACLAPASQPFLGLGLESIQA